MDPDARCAAVLASAARPLPAFEDWSAVGEPAVPELEVVGLGTTGPVPVGADQALGYVLDGLTYETPGMGKLRLLSGYAQCQANLGDSRGAKDALNLAPSECDRVSAGQRAGHLRIQRCQTAVLGGSSPTWRDGGQDAERAAREAGEAIAIWEHEPPDSRSLDDEAPAHVYQATAYLQLGQLDAATTAIRPILDLPVERQISWIRRRLARFADLFRNDHYVASHEAADLYDEIQTLAS